MRSQVIDTYQFDWKHVIQRRQTGPGFIRQPVSLLNIQSNYAFNLEIVRLSLYGLRNWLEWEMFDFNVGVRLKKLRVSFGFSQRQLADAAGVPHGQISMIETNKSSPSVASLRKILGGMNIGMSEFFEPDATTNPNTFFTPTDLRDLTSLLYPPQQTEGGKITLKQVGDARKHNLQILHETYESGADTGDDMLEHVASEGGVVIAGEIELTVGGQIKTLKVGDAYLFNSQEPHRFRNTSDRPATVISACTPPYL